MRTWERLKAERAYAKATGRTEQLAGGWGQSGHDYGILTNKGFLSQFFLSMEDSLGSSFASRISTRISSNQRVEFHKGLGTPPVLREWVGDRQLRGIPVYSQKIENTLYEASLDVAVEDYRFDKSGQLLMRMGELGTRAAQHWEKLSTETIEANPLAYDGQALFATTHTFGGDGPAAIKNDLAVADVPSLGWASPSKPTFAEFSQAIVDCVQHLFTFRDAFNYPINGGARKFLVMVPTQMWGSGLAAIRAQRLNFGQSNVAQLQDVTYDVVPNPFLTTSAVAPVNPERYFYVFREDALLRALILQEALAPEVQFQGPGSYPEFIGNKFLFGIKAERGAGPGAWQHALRCKGGN